MHNVNYIQMPSLTGCGTSVPSSGKTVPILKNNIQW